MAHHLFDLDGRTALVTGSSRGIGRALATGLLEAGCTVVLNARNQQQLRRTQEELAADFGDAVRSVAFDNTDPAAVTAAVAEIESTIAPIDILVNNTGAQHRAPLTEF